MGPQSPEKIGKHLLLWPATNKPRKPRELWFFQWCVGRVMGWETSPNPKHQVLFFTDPHTPLTYSVYTMEIFTCEFIFKPWNIRKGKSVLWSLPAVPVASVWVVRCVDTEEKGYGMNYELCVKSGMDGGRCCPGVSGTHQGWMSDSKQWKPDLSGTGEMKKMQVAIGFPKSAVLDESFSWEETVSEDKTTSWQPPVERSCLTGVAGSALVS